MRCGGCRSNVKQVVDTAVEHEFQKTRAASATVMLEMVAPAKG